MKKRADLQGIRGIAISSVLLYHFFPDTFKNGYVGVDQFFILSGFLMAEILSRESSLSFSGISAFYYRRLKIILPLYALFIICTLLASLTVFPPTTFSFNIPYALRSLAFISNTKLGGASPTYEELLANAEVLYTHTWSLSCEVQFYVIAPFLIVLPAMFNNKICISTIGLISYFSFAYLYETGQQELAFNSMFTRIWQFGLGCLCSVLLHRNDKSSVSVDYELLLPEKNPVEDDDCDDVSSKSESTVLWFYSNLVLFSLLLLCWFPVEVTSHFVRLFTCFNTACLIYSGGLTEPNALLSNRFLVYLGDISYSLYLIHWPVCVYLKQNEMNSVQGCVLGIAFSALLASITYETYEKFYLKLEKPSIIGLTVLLYAACIAVIIICSPKSLFYPEEKIVVTQPYLEIPENLTLEMVMDLNNNFAKLDVPLLTMKECSYKTINPHEDTPFGKLCTVNSTKHIGTKRLMVMGNSLAANIARMFIRLEECQKKAQLIQLYSRVACEVLDDTVHGTFCLKKNDQFHEVVRMVKPDVLFITVRHLNSMMPAKDKLVDDILEYEKRMLKRIEEVNRYCLETLFTTFMFLCNNGLKIGKKIPQDDLIDHSENRQYLLARNRMKLLSEWCTKCELIDVLPSLTTKNGTYQMYDEENGLVHMVQGHFTNYGLQKISNEFRKACNKIIQ